MKHVTNITKKLVFDKALSVADVGTKYLRIVFEGQSAFEPIISSLTLECNEMVNILGANTQNVGGKAYGQMLIELPENSISIKRIKDYLDISSISY